MFSKNFYFYKKIIAILTTPPHLKKGDTVAIISPASFIQQEVLNNAVNVIEHLGYRVKVGKNALKRNNQFAGTDSERLDDLQQVLDDENVRMILCARGGYGMIRLIDRLDFKQFVKSPKWIAGYSDITALQAHLYSVYNIESLHGIMPLNFAQNGIPDIPVIKLFEAARGEQLSYKTGSHILNRPGLAQAELVGGNLAMLLSLQGSTSDFSTHGKILFIEEVGEVLYRLDRMMFTLKRAGKLENLAALVVGGLTDMEDSAAGFGLTAEEIISEAVAGYDFPVSFGFPAGHIRENFPLIIGRKATLNVSGQKTTLDFT
jgi:muramoyltetrapeptide carboxypeptidase